MRRVLTPKWLALHALAVVIVLAFLRLGWWQWSRAESTAGTLQNVGYAFEWPVFAGFVVFLWWKTVRDELRRGRAVPGDDGAAEGASDGGVVVGVTAQPRPTEDLEPDPELDEYNRYLASLHARSTGVRP